MLAIHEHIKLGRRINDKKSLKLFQNVVYSIDGALDEKQKQRVSRKPWPTLDITITDLPNVHL